MKRKLGVSDAYLVVEMTPGRLAFKALNMRRGVLNYVLAAEVCGSIKAKVGQDERVQGKGEKARRKGGRANARGDAGK